MMRRPDRVIGSADEAFWAHCERHELRLQRCADCTQLTWPAGPVCDHCGSGNLAWDRLSGRGKLVSWCRFHQDYYRGQIPTPYDCIVVELEEGMLFISNPDGFGAEDFSSGMPVRVEFRACEDRHGPYQLPVFVRDEPGDAVD